MNAEAALVDDPMELVDPRFARVAHFAGASRIEAACDYGEDQSLKRRLERGIEGAVDKDVPRRIGRHARGYPAFFDRYLPTARSAWLLVRFARFDIGFCDKADPAADLGLFELRLSDNTLEAALPARSPLSLFFAMSRRSLL
jgi:hypothetical protein